MERSLSILMTHLHLDTPSGSETYTETAAGALIEAGHRIVAYSPLLGEMASRIRALGADVVDDLSQLEGRSFDVIHAQHNVTAMQARARFPDVPLVYHSHGLVPLPEQPPSVDINVQRYIAFSEEVAAHLASQGVAADLITVLHNPVDLGRFRQGPPLHEPPQRGLVVSNIIDEDTLAVIHAACSQASIDVQRVGGKANASDVGSVMRAVDIVFSLGRGAIEAMASGRAVYVYDVHGADGWVTRESIDEMVKSNLSGRRGGLRLSPRELVEDLERYDPEMGRVNRQIAEERFSVAAHIPMLIEVYEEAISGFASKGLTIPGQELDTALSELRNRLSERGIAERERRTELESWARRLSQREGVIRERELAYARTKVPPGGEDTLLELERRIWEVEHSRERAWDSATYRAFVRFVHSLNRVAPWGTRRRSFLLAPARAAQVVSERGWGGFLLRLLAFWRWVPKLFVRAMPDQDAMIPRERYLLWERLRHLPPRRMRQIRKAARAFTYRPLISVVMPTYNSDPAMLTRAIESLGKQVYEHWELCMADDASPREASRAELRRWADIEKRIRVRFLKTNMGISGATNAALAQARGEFVALLDHDDELKPDAFYEIVKLLNDHPDVDYIYSDEDKVTPEGELSDVFLKPDWSPDLLLSMNYVSHLSVIRTSVLRGVGGFRTEYDGSQDYDMTLRVTELTDRIAHIPLPLYSWRSVPGSAAAGNEEKPWAYEAARRALVDAMRRRGIDAEVHYGPFIGSYRVEYAIKDNPSVEVIVDATEDPGQLQASLASISRSSYGRYVVNVVARAETDIPEEVRNRVVRARSAGSTSEALNTAAREAKTADYLLFVRSTVRVIDPRWIEALVEHGQREDVAVVGGRIVRPDGAPVHDGVVIGLKPQIVPGKEKGAHVALGKVGRNVSAVSGACLLIRRDLFLELGGFDEKLAPSLADIDLCLRAREKGHLVVYTPYATLGNEAGGVASDQARQGAALFARRWSDYRDPYYHPSLSLDDPYTIRV